MANRELYFKIERLNQDGILIEEKNLSLISGEVKVARDSIYRRTCKFDLSEPLPDSWLGDLWRLWYGQLINGTVVYESLGVFIPLDPIETQDGTGRLTSYQGVDKTKWLIDSIGQGPIQFSTNDTLKDVASVHLDAIGETRRNLVDVPYSLNTNYTFAEYREAEHTLRTLVDSFTCDFYYDRNGYATLVELPAPNSRPISYTFEDNESSVFVESKRKVETSNYWNRVIVVGGSTDSEIFRSILFDYSSDVSSQTVTQTNKNQNHAIFEDGTFTRAGQDFVIPQGIDNLRSIILSMRNFTGVAKDVTVLMYNSVDDFNADVWYAPTNQRAIGTANVSSGSFSDIEFVFDEPFGVIPGESLFIAIINDNDTAVILEYHDTSQYADGQRYFVAYVGGGGTITLDPVAGDLYFKITSYVPDANGRRITRYFKEDAATSQDQVDALAVKYLDEGIRIPSTISLQNFPITSLEVKDIIVKDGIKYEVLDFNIPLGLGLQTINAGKVL